MPKIDAIVGNAALRISGAAKKIGDAQIGERMSRAPGKLKQWGRDNIKLPHAKVQADYREYLADNVPVENTPTTEKGEFPAARDCLTMLEQSPKKCNVVFLAGALNMADELGEMVFQSDHGYDQELDRIGSDFGNWLKQYDSHQVKNIARNAERAIEHASLVALDVVRTVSRTKILKQVIKACDERLTELQKSPAPRSKDSSAIRATPTPKPSQTASPALLNSAVTPKPVVGAPQIEETADQARPDTPTSQMKLAAEQTFSAIEFEGVDMYLTSLETGAVPAPAVSTSAALRQADPLAKTEDQELTAIERLHGTIKDYHDAILDKNHDVYRKARNKLSELRAELGQKAYFAAVALERQQLPPEVLSELTVKADEMRLRPAERSQGAKEDVIDVDAFHDALAELPPRVQPSYDGQLEDLLRSTELHAAIKDMFAARKDMKVDLYIDTLERIKEFRAELGWEAIDAAMAQERKELLPETLSILKANKRKFDALVESRLAEHNEKDGPASPRRWQRPRRPTTQRPQFVRPAAGNLPKPTSLDPAVVEQAKKLIRIMNRGNIRAFLGILNALTKKPEARVALGKALEEAMKTEPLDKGSIERLSYLMDKLPALANDEAFDINARMEIGKLFNTWAELKVQNPHLAPPRQHPIFASRRKKSVARDDLVLTKNELTKLFPNPEVHGRPLKFRPTPRASG
jgi:hypothetical protein